MGISREQALDCFRSDDLVGIGMEADAVRRRLHPEGVVGYAIQSTIDCGALTSSSPEQQLQGTCTAIADALDWGATGVQLANCGNASRTETLLRGIRRRFPGLWIEGFSSAGVAGFADEGGLSLRDALARLMDAGLNSIADEGIGPADAGETAVSHWLELHRAAHGLGMQTVAGLVFRVGDNAEQLLNLLDAVRGLQHETGGFASIALSTAAAPNGRELDGVTAVERLKTLAIARMFLDTIENVQATATQERLKVLQMELRFGANDVGAIAPASGREEDIRRIIRDAGFRPAQREIGYRAMAIG